METSVRVRKRSEIDQHIDLLITGTRAAAQYFNDWIAPHHCIDKLFNIMSLATVDQLLDPHFKITAFNLPILSYGQRPVA